MRCDDHLPTPRRSSLGVWSSDVLGEESAAGHGDVCDLYLHYRSWGPDGTSGDLYLRVGVYLA